MRYEDLNSHFRERIRERVTDRLAQSDAAIDTNMRDVIVLCIILLADENNIPRATGRLYDMKRTDKADSITYDDALNLIVWVYQHFKTEVSILFDLYQMQQEQKDIMDIIAYMEVRLLEEPPNTALEPTPN